jgi:hypothetical protein
MMLIISVLVIPVFITPTSAASNRHLASPRLSATAIERTVFTETESNDDAATANLIDDHYLGNPHYAISGKIDDSSQDVDLYTFTVTMPGVVSLTGLWDGTFRDSGYEEDFMIDLFAAGDMVQPIASARLILGGRVMWGKYRQLDSTLKPGQYYIQVQESQSKQNDYVNEAYSLTLDFKPDYTPYTAQISRFSVLSLTSNSVSLVWNAAPEASGYRIYRATSPAGKFTLVATKSTTRYKNTRLKLGTTYYYKIAAYKLAGKTKIISRAFSNVLSAKTAPSTPASLTVKRVSSTSVKSSWIKVSGVSGYEIWRSESSIGSFKLLKSLKTNSYTNTKLKKGQTYYYKVRSWQMAGKKKVYGAFTAVKSVKSVKP